jgi:hypothetical protein
MEDPFKTYLEELNSMIDKNEVYAVITSCQTDKIMIPAIKKYGILPPYEDEPEYRVFNFEWRIHFPRKDIDSYEEHQGIYTIVVGNYMKITMRIYSEEEIEVLNRTIRFVMKNGTIEQFVLPKLN